MNEYEVTIESSNFALRRFDIIIELLFAALLLFMPLAFGVRTAFSEEVVIFLSGAIAVCFLLRCMFCDRAGLVWTWAYVPIILFILVVIIQLVPFPASSIGVVSPNTGILRNELLGDLPNADKYIKAFPFSFYPNATRHDLRLLLSILSVFVVVVSYYRRADRIKRLLFSIALIGGVVAAIAFAQDVFGNGKIYWFVTDPVSTTLSGPFVNHNHYGQFMNLSIGAALALICVKMHECFAHRKIVPSVIYDFLGSDSAKILWLLVAIMVLGVTTIFISLTRGGMVSMIIASAFATLLLISRPSLKGRGWVMAVMILVAFACILYVGFDSVYNRFATLGELHTYQWRLQILRDLTALFRQFPILGTGLGTHSVVYPMFKQIGDVLLYTHVENEYAQVLEETGVIGLAILIIFGIIVSFDFVKSVKCVRFPVCSAVYGLGYGLMAILIHSLSDFGQHMPANAYLSAIFCALIVSLAIYGKQPNLSLRTVPRFCFLYILPLLGTCGIFLWALAGANNARIAEDYWKKTLDMEKRIKANEWKGTASEYAELISNAESAVAYQPDNTRYQYWLNVYRWRSISQEENPDTGAVIIADESMPVLRDVIDGFYKASVLCPTYGPPYSVVGQIEKFILNEDGGAEKIRKGFRLAPNDPITCLVAGNLDVLEGNIQNSIGKFNKAVQLESGLFYTVVDIYVYQLSRPDLALSIAEKHTGWLGHVANVFDDMQYSDLAAQAREKMKEQLELQCNNLDAPGDVYAQLGSIYCSQGKIEQAAECYQQALAREYSQVYWRLELAKLLVKMDKVQDAMSEAKICLQLRPQFEAAETLITDLSVHPALLMQKNTTP